MNTDPINVIDLDTLTVDQRLEYAKVEALIGIREELALLHGQRDKRTWRGQDVTG